MGGGRPEKVIKIDQPCRRCARVAVDGLVIIADGEDVGGGPSEKPNQQHVGGSQILEFVNEQDLAGASSRVTGRDISQQDLDGPQDLLIEIDGVLAGQHIPVLGEHVGEVFHVAAEFLFDRSRRSEAQTTGPQCFDPYRHRVRHSLPPSLDELIENRSHASLIDHAWAAPAGGRCERCRARHDGQRQAIECADLKAGEVASSLLHLFSSAHVESE